MDPEENHDVFALRPFSLPPLGSVSHTAAAPMAVGAQALVKSPFDQLAISASALQDDDLRPLRIFGREALLSLRACERFFQLSNATARINFVDRHSILDGR
jgi:hypothetical protein